MTLDGDEMPGRVDAPFNAWVMELADRVRSGQWISPALVSPAGTHGWSYEVDEDGDEYLALGMTLPKGVMAEVDAGTYGTLQCLRFYTGRRVDEDGER